MRFKSLLEHVHSFYHIYSFKQIVLCVLRFILVIIIFFNNEQKKTTTIRILMKWSVFCFFFGVRVCVCVFTLELILNVLASADSLNDRTFDYLFIERSCVIHIFMMRIVIKILPNFCSWKFTFEIKFRYSIAHIFDKWCNKMRENIIHFFRMFFVVFECVEPVDQLYVLNLSQQSRQMLSMRTSAFPAKQ